MTEEKFWLMKSERV